MIFLLLGGLAAVVPAALIFGLFFMRSSKKFPATPSQLLSEVRWQIGGLVGMIEDHLLRCKNHTELFDQSGRVAVITGGNRGIGLSVVESLLKCDFTVIMGVRNPAQAKAAVEALSVAKGRCLYEELDIGNMASVRQFAQRVRARHPQIDVLINNAGIMAAPYARTAEGFEEQLAVNYLGHFLLAHLLMPELRAAGTTERRSRIVNVSSCVHRQGVINFDDIHGENTSYPPVAYNQSKLAQVLFTKHLQQQLSVRGEPIQTHAVHPGIVDTGLFVHTTSTHIPWFKRVMFKSAAEGATTIVHAAIAPKLEGNGGTYLSNCTRQRMHSATKDAKQCERLFALSCAMLGISEFFSEKK